MIEDSEFSGLDLSPEGIARHPGLLRLDLSRCGLGLGGTRAEAEALARKHGIFTPDVDLFLSNDLRVTAGIHEHSDSPYRLEESAGKTYLIRKDLKEPLAVRIDPSPPYYQRRTAQGRAYNSIVNVHGRFIYIFPFEQCSYVDDQTACAYCHFQPESRGSSREKSLEDVLEVLKVVFREGAPELVYLSVGDMRTEDGGILAIEPYVRMIKKHFDTLVGIEVMAPERVSWIIRAYAMGADAVCFSMGVFDPELFARYLPGRARLDGYQRYLTALKYAASIFPRGAVYTRLMVGMEPIHSTLQGVNRLAEFGVAPLLPLYSPPTSLRGPTPPARRDLPMEALVGLYRSWRRTLETQRLDTYWVRPISMATMPIDETVFQPLGSASSTPFFGRGLNERRGWERWVHRLGATLRRRLRVRALDSGGGHE